MWSWAPAADNAGPENVGARLAPCDDRLDILDGCRTSFTRRNASHDASLATADERLESVVFKRTDVGPAFARQMVNMADKAGQGRGSVCKQTDFSAAP